MMLWFRIDTLYVCICMYTVTFCAIVVLAAQLLLIQLPEFFFWKLVRESDAKLLTDAFTILMLLTERGRNDLSSPI